MFVSAESLGSALNRITKNLRASFHFDLFVLDFAGVSKYFSGFVHLADSMLT